MHSCNSIGVVFVFTPNSTQFNTFGQQGNISASDITPYGWFGRSLALHEPSGTLVIGANQDNTVATYISIATITNIKEKQEQLIYTPAIHQNLSHLHRLCIKQEQS